MGKRNHMIVIESEGFAFVGAGIERVSAPWSAVRQVTAYKLDLITTDEVRLKIDLDVYPFSVEVSEEMEGFEKFKSAAEKHFQFPVAWWPQVLQPAFVANMRVLFSRN